MAYGEYYPVITNFTNTSTYAWNGTWTTGNPVYVTGPAPKPQTPLEWLDAEVEKTCARGRLAAA